MKIRKILLSILTLVSCCYPSTFAMHRLSDNDLGKVRSFSMYEPRNNTTLFSGNEFGGAGKAIGNCDKTICEVTASLLETIFTGSNQYSMGSK